MKTSGEEDKDTDSIATERPKTAESSLAKVPVERIEEGAPEAVKVIGSSTVSKEENAPSPSPVTTEAEDARISESRDSFQHSIRPSFQTDERISFDRRVSSQSLRPSISDIQSGYRYKPKIKFGPRPSLEQTSATPTGTSARPVSTLPAGIQMAQRAPKSHFERPKTQQTPSKSFFGGSSTAVPPMPAPVSVAGSSRFDRPPSRAGSAITVPAYTHYPESLLSDAGSTSSSVTPEKQRLMKALQKRKKARMAKAAAEESKPPLEEQSKAIEETGPSAGGVEFSATKAGLATKKLASVAAEPLSHTSNHVTNAEGGPHEIESQLVDLHSGTGEETPKARSRDTLVPGLEEEKALQLSDEGEGKSEAQAPPHQVVEQSDKVKEQPSIWPDVNASAQVDEENGQDRKLDLNGATVETTDKQDLVSSDDLEARQDLPSEAETVPLSPTLLSPIATEADSAAASVEPSPVSPVTDAKESVEHGLAKSDDETSEERHDEPREMSLDELNTAEKNQSKRRGVITPIKTGDVSDTTSLSGDSFLEELQTATFEEATPMIVAKSPANPFFPLSPKSVDSHRSSGGANGARSPSSGAIEDDIPPVPSNSVSPTSAKDNRSGSFGSLSRFMPTRSASNPIDQVPFQKSQPGTPNGLSSWPSSSSLAGKRDSPVDSNGPKKSGVSSLISQRIKAFEKFSTSAPPSNGSTPIITQSMVSQRKTSFNTPPTSAGTDARGNSQPSSPGVIPTPSPEVVQASPPA